MATTTGMERIRPLGIRLLRSGALAALAVLCGGLLAPAAAAGEDRLQRELEEAWARDEASWEAAIERAERRRRLLGADGGGVGTDPGTEAGTSAAASADRRSRLSRTDSRATPRRERATPAASEATPARGGDGPKAALEARGFTCSDAVEGWGCPDLQRRLAEARPGELLALPKGDYVQCVVQPKGKPLRLDFQGSRLHGKACAGKAAIVQTAPLQIRNVECFDIAVPHGNGACVRHQSGGLALHDVIFRDSQSGVLASPNAGPLRIRGGRFEGLGGDCSLKCGRAHGIYYQGPELHIRGATFARARDEGHLVKTGAAKTVIVDSTFDETEGLGSRVIDAYNGGILELRDIRILATPGDGNPDVIGFDHERRQDHPENRITVAGSRIDCAGGPLVGGREDLGSVAIMLKDNALSACRLPVGEGG